MIKGTIINISRFCTDDGPGIRTTVFLKGCPLECVWCHNPESQNPKPELWFDKKKCTGCRLCEAACPNGCHTFEGDVHRVDLKKCMACGKCAEVCPQNATEIIGKTVSADEVVSEALKDSAFYKNSGGGVTLSGGEPLFQPEFSAEILRLCKQNGIHTAIETSGFATEGDFKRVLSYCDLVLFDIKETNEEKHKEFTRVSFEAVLNSLKLINKMKIPFRLRMPVIPSLNDRKEHFAKVKEIIGNMEYCQGVEVLPYHTLGVYKYELLNKVYFNTELKEPNPETVDKWKAEFN